MSVSLSLSSLPPNVHRYLLFKTFYLCISIFLYMQPDVKLSSKNRFSPLKINLICVSPLTCYVNKLIKWLNRFRPSLIAVYAIWPLTLSWFSPTHNPMAVFLFLLGDMSLLFIKHHWFYLEHSRRRITDRS
jgi:hypothetical protein